MKFPAPGKAAFAGSASRFNRTDRRQEKHKDYTGEVPTDIPPGNASVSATRGFKHWFSTRDAGLTVESTITVTLSCDQESSAIELAAEEAGRLAEDLAHRGCKDMDLYIEKFIEDTRA